MHQVSPSARQVSHQFQAQRSVHNFRWLAAASLKNYPSQTSNFPRHFNFLRNKKKPTSLLLLLAVVSTRIRIWSMTAATDDAVFTLQYRTFSATWSWLVTRRKRRSERLQGNEIKRVTI